MDRMNQNIYEHKYTNYIFFLIRVIFASLCISIPMGNTIRIFTDGSSRGNPGKGGYGVILCFKDQRKRLSGGFRYTTNNRMELMAVITALQSIKNFSLPTIIYSDSKYIINAITKNWVTKWSKNNWSIKNPDLWQQLFLLIKKFKDINFIWVKGHADNEYNALCDKIAVEAANEQDLQIDEYYERNAKNQSSTKK